MKKKLIEVKSKTYCLNEKNEFYLSEYSIENINTGEYISYSYSEDGTVYSHYHVTKKGDIKEIYRINNRWGENEYWKYIGENEVEYSRTSYYLSNDKDYKNKKRITTSTTYTEYNDDNQITKKIFKENKIGEEPFYKEVDFQYDEKGNCIYYAESPTTIISAEYNENNQVVSSIVKDYISNSIDNYNYYYENGILIKLTCKLLYSSGMEIGRYERHFNEKGNVTAFISKYIGEGEDIEIGTMSYIYDENDNLIETKEWKGGILKSIEQKRYNSLNLLVEEYYKDYDDEKEEDEDDFYYNANEERRTIISYDDDNEKTGTKTYDRKNKLVEYTTIENIYEIDKKDEIHLIEKYPPAIKELQNYNSINKEVLCKWIKRHKHLYFTTITPYTNFGRWLEYNKEALSQDDIIKCVFLEIYSNIEILSSEYVSEDFLGIYMEHLEEKVLPNIESYGKKKYPPNYYYYDTFDYFFGNDLPF